MKKFTLFLLTISAVLLYTPLGSALASDWDIDRAHSNIYFDVKHTFATVRGQFEDFSGSIQFDPDNPTALSTSFTVNTKSINTGIANRDNHLRSADFFEVKKHPTMTFQSTGVKHKQGDQYTLEGTLTIRGDARQVAVPFTYLGTRENPLKKGQMVSGFEARFSIDRLDYGVGSGKFFKMGAIGKRVDVLVALEVLQK